MPSGTNPNAPGGDGSWSSGGGGGADMIGALINVGGMLYDSHQNRKAAKKNTEMTIAANKAEAELAYQRQMEMWNAQNLYNSPAAQMARFKAGGLNPHLIYGQGNSGNASSAPAYQPPNIQYRYEGGRYGAAVSSLLPTLMSVGSWLTDMRAKEVGIQQTIQQTEKGAVDVEKARQLISFLEQRYPKDLQNLDNKLGLFPYQQSMQQAQTEKAWRVNSDLEQEYFNKWGSQVYANQSNQDIGAKPGSAKAIERLHQLAKLNAAGYQNKLLQAKSSFTDFNVTDPQALMQMVLGGIMSMTGQQIRARAPQRIRQTPKRHEQPHWDK